ncbi:MAG: FkbM family methyltransferase [Bacteroidetes bacterium]|nr:FkbM family methyltransferase [Bacteroidota bacterium]
MGQYLSRLSKIVKRGKIISVEPIPSNIIALNFMKSILRIKNAIIINKAIAEKPGSAIITIPKMSGIPISTQASFIENLTLKESEKEKIEVETTTIDKIVDSLHLHKINFIKVDTEGFDSIALKSGANSIRKFMPLLKVEGSCFKPEMNWLFDLGYKAFKFKCNRVVLINNNDDNIKYKGDTYLSSKEQLDRILKTFNT